MLALTWKPLRSSAMDCVYSCKWVTRGHFRIDVDGCVVYTLSEGLPVIGTAETIVCFANCMYFVLWSLKTLMYNAHFRAYSVEVTDKCAINYFDLS
jgi:hypothetical protein